MSEEAPANAPVRPSKKRKKKRAPSGAAETKRASGPSFAKDFPKDADLDRLVAAFEEGDYGRVREEAPLLAKRTESDEVRRAARELRKRVDPDPLSVYLLAIAAVLLGVLAYWYWSHAHVGA